MEELTKEIDRRSGFDAGASILSNFVRCLHLHMSIGLKDNTAHSGYSENNAKRVDTRACVALSSALE